jgi:hypothetical protein
MTQTRDRRTLRGVVTLAVAAVIALGPVLATAAMDGSTVAHVPLQLVAGVVVAVALATTVALLGPAPTIAEPAEADETSS